VQVLGLREGAASVKSEVVTLKGCLAYLLVRAATDAEQRAKAQLGQLKYSALALRP